MKLYEKRRDTIIETKIKPNLKLIYQLRIQGFRDSHIARVLGISVSLFTEILAECTELKDAYEDATLILCSKLRDVAISRALGTDGKKDKDGGLLGPDANLALRILEKIDPQYSSKQQHMDVNVTVEHIIHEINEKRRIEEKEVEEKAKEKGYVS